MTPIRSVPAAALGALAFVLLSASPVAAHVTVHSADAVQGASDALVAVRVPNEEDAATTSRVEVDLPADTPLIGVLVQPTPGWQFTATMSALPKPVVTDDGTITQYVSKIVWTGGSIPAGGYQDFNLDVSSLPKVATVTIKALQTYSNGDIVRWIDPPVGPGLPAPAHPAPTLDLVAPGSSAAAPTTVLAQAPSVSTSGGATSGDVNGAKTLAVVALVVALLGLLAAGAAWLFGRRTAG